MKFLATIILILVLGSPQSGRCQGHRLEFPVEGKQLPYDLTPVGEYGFLLMELDGIPLSQEVTQFNFIHYSTDFNLSFNFPIQVNRNLLLVAKEFSGDQAVFVFQNPKYNRLQVTRIIIPQKMVNTTLVELTPGIEVLDLEAWKDKAWISASLNNQAILFEVDLEENKKRTLPTGIGFPVIAIHDLQHNSDRAELSYLMGLTINKRKAYAVRTLNSDGKVVDDIVLGQNANLNFLSGQLCSREDQLIIVGFYNSNQTEVPKGVALIQVQSENEQDLRLYPFKDLPQFFFNYTADPGSIAEANGDLIKLKKTKGSASNMLFRLDNLLVKPDQLLMSLDVYSKTYRSRNEEERQALADNIDFAVNYKGYTPNLPLDPDAVSNQAPSMIDEQRIRYKDNVIQSLIQTGVGYHHSSYLAFGPKLELLWNFSIRFSQQDDGFAAFNKSLSDQGMIISGNPKSNDIVAYRIESSNRLIPQAPVSLVSGEEKGSIQTGTIMTDIWIGNRNLVWGYQLIGRGAEKQSQFFVQDLVFGN